MALIVSALAFGGFALWDIGRIYNGARSNGDLLKYKPANGDSNSALSELTALNEDVRAWLTIDDTGIDYPVVQGKTNMEYINTDVYGEYSLSGSIFMDSRSAVDLSDFYTLIYGHHMDGGAMFGDLANFREKEYFDSHTTGTLYTPEKTFKLELYACLAVNAYDERVFDPSAQDADFLNYIKDNAVLYRDIGVSADDRIVGLSTCSDAATDGRIVVCARMTEITN